MAKANLHDFFLWCAGEIVNCSTKNSWTFCINIALTENHGVIKVEVLQANSFSIKEHIARYPFGKGIIFFTFRLVLEHWKPTK